MRRLHATYDGTPVPLLVVRARDLHGIAWRKGRAAARDAERRRLRSFVETATRTLRAGDLLAHDPGSEDYLAALVSRRNGEGSVAAPADCRAALVRLASGMERRSGVGVETGWTLLQRPGSDRLEDAIAGAMERGARERERYAFFSTIGHELRTPLTSISGYLEIVLEEDLPPPVARKFLHVARAEALRMERLVEGMFELSLLDMRERGHRESASPLDGPLTAAANAVAPLAAAQSAVIECEACDALDVAVGFDRLTQVLINVLDNAVKHGGERGRIVVSATKLDERYVQVCVDDDGAGVPLEERETIFALAHRGEGARGRGSGIGLAVARLIVERSGGEMDVVESPLGGARFRLRLPLAGGATA